MCGCRRKKLREGSDEEERKERGRGSELVDKLVRLVKLGL